MGVTGRSTLSPPASGRAGIFFSPNRNFILSECGLGVGFSFRNEVYVMVTTPTHKIPFNKLKYNDCFFFYRFTLDFY